MGGPDRPTVPVIVGATGIGKTAVATELAGLLSIAVISADARQVYRHLDIGTAKPGPDVRRILPHYGIDLIEPGERYSAGAFARDAVEWLAEARSAGRTPLVVGGTGLYVRALADGLFREPPLDAARREPLRVWVARLTSERAAHWAARLDRGFAGGGRQRAGRAIEVALLTGRPLSWWQRDARERGVMRPWYIHLTLPRELVTRRIAERVDRMLASGLIAEVEGLLGRGIRADTAGLDGIGYREVCAMLRGEIALSGLRDAIVTSTRRYAKRQETWFRHQLRPGQGGPAARESVWVLDASEAPARLAGQIAERWRQRSAA